MGFAGAPVVLVAHGSRDPRAATATRALARAVADARPGLAVYESFLEHTLPRPDQVLSSLQRAGHRSAVVVPLLLTAAYHGRVDIPGALAAARADGLRLDAALADVLGPVHGEPDPLLVTGLRRRLAAAVGEVDAVVLAAAGTRDAGARAGIERVAAALGGALGVPGAVAYASAAPPTAAAAVAGLRAAGAQRVGVAAYFLAPGLLYDAVVTSAEAAGAAGVAAPLEAAGEMAALVLARVDAAGTAGLAPADPTRWGTEGAARLDLTGVTRLSAVPPARDGRRAA